MIKTALVLAMGLTLAACDRASSDVADNAGAVAMIAYDGADYSGDADKLAHGKRLASVLNCEGCHRATLEGRPFPPQSPVETGLYASNLTRAVPTMTDEQLERLLREGVHPTRDNLIIMPSAVYQHLSAPDMAALIAYLRSLEPSGDETPPPALTLEFRRMIDDDLAAFAEEEGIALARDENGLLELPNATLSVARNAAKPPIDLGEGHALGRYIAMTTCAECHGSDLKSGFAPPLPTVAGVYDRTSLATLLSTGVGVDGRELGLMSIVGRETFADLTAEERAAIVGYVLALAAREMETPQ